MDYELAEQLKDAGFPQRPANGSKSTLASLAFAVTPMHPIKDKCARLRVAARYIKMGVVKFPCTGWEQLMTQLLGFGSGKHDDAVDALVYLILGLVGDGIEEPKVHLI
jgi:phage terminase large subunit-like protein